MAVPVGSGGGGGVGVNTAGAWPQVLAWSAVAAGFVLVGSRWPAWSYGTLAVVLLYLALTHTSELDSIRASWTNALASTFSR
jgi:hypothetical protein